MDDFTYQKPVDALRADLTELLKKRVDLDALIQAHRMSITGLLRLKDPTFGAKPAARDELLSVSQMMDERLEEVAHPDMPLMALPKLTDSCRLILKSFPGPLTAADVRRELELLGFDFSHYSSNPLSSIHTVLKRLAEAGEVQAGTSREGRAAYHWKDELHRLG